MAVSNSLYRYRQMKSAIALTLATAATAIGLIFLVWILWTTLLNGFQALSSKLVTEMTPPPGEDGGLANAFMGSLMMVALAVVIGTPVGVLAGTYLAEFSRGKKIGDLIRFMNDILLSAPSIIIGLFVYELVVRQSGHFSGYAGGIALAFIFLPVVVRTTDEMLRRRRHPDGHPARHRPHLRRDGAAAVHDAEQPVLEHRHVRADGQHPRRHLPVRHEPL